MLVSPYRLKGKSVLIVVSRAISLEIVGFPGGHGKIGHGYATVAITVLIAENRAITLGIVGFPGRHGRSGHR